MTDLNLTNIGKVDIKDVYADINFFEGDTQVGSLKTQHASLASRQNIALYTPWENNMPPGIYTARAIVHADENITTANATFFIGTKDIVLQDITHKLIAGRVNQVQMVLMNRWNAPLYGVRLVINAGPDAAAPWRAVGPDFELQPWQNVSINYYLNVPAVSPGTYPGHLDFTFDGQTKSIPVQFQVESNPELQAPAANNVSVTVMRLLIVLVVAVLVFLYLRRKKEERSHETR